MNEPAVSLHDRIAMGLSEGRIRAGGLLFVEVPAPVSASASVAGERQRVYVTSDVDPAHLAFLLGIERFAVVASRILSISRNGYAWVLDYGIDSVRHRLLIPLFGPHIGRLIDLTAHGDAVLVFTSCEEEDIETVLETPLRVSYQDLQLVRQHWRSRIERGTAAGLLQAIDKVSTADDVGTQGAGVSRCYVSVVLSEDFEDRVAKVMPGFMLS